MMKSIFPILRLTLFALLCLTGIQQAPAQTCTVSATPVAFGVYNPNNTLPTDATGTITVVCQATVSLLVSYTIKLSAGNGTLTARKMITSGSQLNYQIYTDTLRSLVWGDGSSSTSYDTGGYLLAVLVPVTTTYTAYGRINALQNSYAGSYTDTLTILVSY